jgi:hypothetical protein
MAKPELALPLRLLRDALTALALPMGEQIRVNGPGCVACDLFEDFDHARIVAVGSENRFSGNQSQMLEAIDHAFQSMQGSEFNVSTATFCVFLRGSGSGNWRRRL